MEAWIEIIAHGIVLVGVFLVIRRLVLWYWKVNEGIALLKEIVVKAETRNRILTNIHDSIIKGVKDES